ncbi:hypothetical protein DPMN_038266 [Dreissena polymorpha]|uniref:Uncharacterized protein n=1 Tax=Dreissena polymorpha TaxID=45954 RepID=A0A9D4MGM2_DREPO|nr:hypothetical protein DPMN_038266 [Dreissena polymorpha]
MDTLLSFIYTVFTQKHNCSVIPPRNVSNILSCRRWVLCSDPQDTATRYNSPNPCSQTSPPPQREIPVCTMPVTLVGILNSFAPPCQHCPVISVA